ncbi:MAG: hypothetical protein ACRDH9_09025 [Actinomycetota bacterium]
MTDTLVLLFSVIIPTAALFVAALKSGYLWLFVVPALAWTSFLFAAGQGPHSTPWMAVVGVVAGWAGVWAGLLVHKSRQEPST